MKKIRVAFCGCGCRTNGTGMAVRAIDTYETVGVCDPYEDKALALADKFEAEKGLRPAVYTDRGSIVEVFKDISVWAGIKSIIDQINANALAA